MTLNLVHALVITPFEAALPAQTFDELLAEDYPIHVVYCPATGKQILNENSFESNPMEKISFLQFAMACTNNQIVWENKILLTSEFEELQKELTK